MSARRLRPVALTAMLAAAACGRTDPAIQVAIDRALLASADTAAPSVDISVNRRMVRLAGEVSSRDQERRVVAAARTVRGVKDVIDELYLSDAGIVDAVKQAVEPGLAVSAKAHARGLRALEELGFRRKGLAVSLIVIFALIAGLVVKIRQIERPREASHD